MSVALFIWFVAVSVAHDRQEVRGKLWEYLGCITRNRFVAEQGPFTGPLFLVHPALLLQIVAAAGAFLIDGPYATFCLALLIAARLSDALFTHFLPNAKGYRPNPGYTTAVVFLVDSLVLLAWSHGQLAADPAKALTGAFIGAGGFAVLQPLMRWTAPLCPLWACALLAALLTACSAVPHGPEPIATRPRGAGEQHGAILEAWREYAGPVERATLFHHNQRIESHVP